MIDSLELTNFQPLADSQGQNFDPGSQLPRSIFLLWESAPRVKILTLGVGSQGQDFDLGSRLPGTWESHLITSVNTLKINSKKTISIIE